MCVSCKRWLPSRVLAGGVPRLVDAVLTRPHNAETLLLFLNGSSLNVITIKATVGEVPPPPPPPLFHHRT